MNNISDDDDLAEYFSGEKLYGDDFSLEQLTDWYHVEAEGYSSLVKGTEAEYTYVYHELNKMHGFRHVDLPQKCIALGIGAAYCEEFVPILSHLAQITTLDPSEKFNISELRGVPVNRVRPSVLGKMPFSDNQFDVITCFGALHHIANVSFIIEECHRVLKPDGVMFCQEPIVSMGNWELPRRGITKNERGIPYNLLVDMVNRCDFEVIRKTLFDFGPLGRLLNATGMSRFSSRSATFLDYVISQLFSFNKKYHRTGLLDKFGPASLYLVLKKKPMIYED